MMTFRVGDVALRVACNGHALVAPQRVRVVAVLRDGRLRVRCPGAHETFGARLADLRAVVPLSATRREKGV